MITELEVLDTFSFKATHFFVSQKSLDVAYNLILIDPHLSKEYLVSRARHFLEGTRYIWADGFYQLSIAIL